MMKKKSGRAKRVGVLEVRREMVRYLFVIRSRVNLNRVLDLNLIFEYVDLPIHSLTQERVSSSNIYREREERDVRIHKELKRGLFYLLNFSLIDRFHSVMI